MPAFNFSPRFADMVRSGQKTQTIRKANRAKAGDTITLYTGQRTSACLKLGEGTIISVTPVRIERCSMRPHGVGLYRRGQDVPQYQGRVQRGNHAA